MTRITAITFCLLGYSVHIALGSTWSEWWTYEGISGPDFWGLVNPEWVFCNKGKKQSPINIDPSKLLYDPNLRTLHVDKHRVNGLLMNTGHDLKIVIDDTAGSHIVNITEGPFIYRYRVTEINLHWGSIDNQGSEHTIDDVAFPAEIQLTAYNTDLYGNYSQALYSTDGLAMIALLVQTGRRSNSEFDLIAQELRQVRYKGGEPVRIRHLSIHNLLPNTQEYMTYQGSITQPGCLETATWVVINKPLFITHQQLEELRNVMQGDEENPKIPMGDNCRPPQRVNDRTVATNINFANPSKGCTMNKEIFYQAATSWRNT